MRLFLFILVLFSSTMARAQNEPPAPPSLNPYADVPQPYLDESDEFSRYCAATPTLKNHYNCECLAAAFLDERIKQGPDIDRSSIMLSIEGTCLDIAGEAGERFQSCMNSPPVAGISHQEYCKCFANMYGRLFEASKEPPSAKLSVQLQTQAMISCSDPNLGKQLYSR